MSLQDLLSQLVDPAPPAPSAFYLIAVALFLLLFVGSSAVYTLRRALFPGNSLHIRLARRFGLAGGLLGIVGLVLLAARYLGIQWLQMRLLLALAVLGVVALASYAVWFSRTRYPALRAAQEAAKTREQFLRSSAHSPRRRARKQKR